MFGMEEGGHNKTYDALFHIISSILGRTIHGTKRKMENKIKFHFAILDKLDTLNARHNLELLFLIAAHVPSWHSFSKIIK